MIKILRRGSPVRFIPGCRVASWFYSYSLLEAGGDLEMTFSPMQIGVWPHGYSDETF